ncbi:hypothetical protein KAR91_74160 [Candidatus Pacearchaeota archaeon]|nr:hypothetical protein [Candidatus Pacearchaeota archaeon]
MIVLSEFARMVLPEILHCPSFTVEDSVRQTIIDFSEQAWIFSKSFNVTVESADINADLNDSVDIDVGEYVTDKIPVAVDEFRINGTSWKLKHLNLENESSYIQYLREADTKIFSFPDNSTLRVHEVTAGQELYFKVVYKPTYQITEIDDVMYNDWLEAIVSGTKMRLMAIPNQPWTNSKMVGYYMGVYRRNISKARRSMAKGYTGESKRVKWRSFGE